MQTPTKPVSEAAILAAHDLNLAAPTGEQVRQPSLPLLTDEENLSAYEAWERRRAARRAS